MANDVGHEQPFGARRGSYSHECLSRTGRCTITVHYKPKEIDPVMWAEAACGGPVTISEAAPHEQ